MIGISKNCHCDKSYAVQLSPIHFNITIFYNWKKTGLPTVLFFVAKLGKIDG